MYNLTTRFILFSFLIVVIGLTGCKKDNCDYEAGTILEITPATLSWLGDTNTTTIFNFISDSGNQKMVDLVCDSKQYPLPECDEVIFDLNTYTIHLDEGDSIRFTANSNNLEINITSQSKEINFRGQCYGDNSPLGKATLVDTWTINDIDYQDLLLIKDDSDTNMQYLDDVYLQKNVGLLAFTYKGEIWFLE